LLTKDYFEGLVPVNINKYVKYNSYDNVEPKISQVYENTFEIKNTQANPDENVVGLNISNECSPEKTNISSKMWKDCFPIGFKEMHYTNDVNCGFRMISDIIQKFSKNKINLNKEQIKTELLEEYLDYFKKSYSMQIIDILIAEGKKTQGVKVKNQTLSFQDFIYSYDYFITNLDIWLMMKRYKIPSIIIATKPIILTNRVKHHLVLYGKQNDIFVFINSTALTTDKIAKYNIIISPEDVTEFSLDVIINEDIKRELITSVSNDFTIDKMFNAFNKNAKATTSNKLNKKLIIKDDEEEKITPDSQTKKQKTRVFIDKTKKRKLKMKIDE
jgi:hypothetical protein